MFLPSLFSLALSLRVHHLAVEVVRTSNRSPSFKVYSKVSLSGRYYFVGKLTAAALFKELRKEGVRIDTTKQSQRLRLRTDWNESGIRYQARVSFYPGSQIDTRLDSPTGVLRFDNMRVFRQSVNEHIQC